MANRLALQARLQGRWGYAGSDNLAGKYNPAGVKVYDFDINGNKALNSDGTQKFHYTAGNEVTGGIARSQSYLSAGRINAMPWSTETNTFDFTMLQEDYLKSIADKPQWRTWPVQPEIKVKLPGIEQKPKPFGTENDLYTTFNESLSQVQDNLI